MKYNKNLSILTFVLVLFLLAAQATGCATNRKCNGKKGVRTPMGLM